MEYSPLNHANWETRLLLLLERPTNRTVPMKFEVCVVSLNDMPRYRALSYCWGQQQSDVGIDIASCIVPVASNLVDALYYSGLLPGEYLWADAICINQADVYEKNYQVGFMDQIYSRAEATTVWVGPAISVTQDAYALLLEWGATLVKHLRRRAFDKDPMTAPTLNPALDAKRYVFETTLRKRKVSSKALQGLRDLFARPYWTRVWIIQEIAKSRRAELRCGEYLFDLELLLLLPEVIGGFPEYTQASLGAIRQFRQQELSEQSTNTKGNLLQALIATRHSAATIALDKVFALIGLASDGRQLVSTPTYAESLPQSFGRLTNAFMGSTSANSVMLMKYYIPVPSEAVCVDWSQLRCLPPWLATTNSSLPFPGRWSFDYKTLRLYTNGRPLGRIHHATCSSRESSPSDKGAYPDELALEIMEHVATSILRQFHPHLLRTLEITDVELADALVRIIRDADRGEQQAGLIYDFDRVRETAESLGRLVIRGNPLWEWARDYIFAKTRTDPSNEVLRPVQGSNIISRAVGKIAIQSPSGTPPVHQINHEERPPIHKRQRRQTPSPGPANSVEGRPAFKVWEFALDGLDGFPYAKLGFAAFGEENPGSLAMVHPDTDKFDSIYQIDQCTLPVVLREHRNGGHILVGEACLGRKEDQSWLEAKEALSILGLSEVDPQRLTVELGLESNADGLW